MVHFPSFHKDMKPNGASRFKSLPKNSSLSLFLSRHDDAICSGFITRLDRSPVSTKKVVFFKALAWNLTVLFLITGLAIWTVVSDLMSTTPTSLKLAITLTKNLLLVTAALIVITSTSIPFFLGECRLRAIYGFRPSELVIRKPPKRTSLEATTHEDQRLERYWRMASRAINPDMLYSNASAALSPCYWTVEYRAVLDAMLCIGKGSFELEDLEFSIWKQHGGKWSACELWRMHEIMNDQQEIAMFKNFLTSAGKQELLTIWEDMVSASSLGSFRYPSPKAYQEMVNVFAKQGLDYETIWSRLSERAQSKV
ncbi:hypothetical protein CVT24_002758 [Panaeolus cyanescens]|uniref:Uncharacterized protein n=1 Tax=Panaeolus cyanescens TaxID=181874 RepID=A0A409VN56_9AGAR|nr:hypothetical protein CVT24_002758 [Panaeolus cyanescens]